MGICWPSMSIRSFGAGTVVNEGMETAPKDLAEHVDQVLWCRLHALVHDSAGADHVRPDAERGVLGGDALDDRGHRALGRSVVRHATHAPEDRQAARRYQRTGAPAGLHALDHVLRTLAEGDESAMLVDADEAVIVVERHVLERCHADRAGVGDDA